MFDFLRIKLHCLGLILKNKEKAGFAGMNAMFFAYLKFIFVYIFGVKLLRLKPASERALNLKFNFFSYKVFINLFEEVFIYKTYFFETTLKKPFIIDCGSNIGLGILYFKKLYPQAVITAFEADKDAFEMMKKNVYDNNLQDIKLINKALYGVKNKTLKFYANSADTGNPVNSLIKRKDEFAFKEPVNVLTDTLSQYITRKVDFLKMDIEGAEYSVLKELSKKRKLKNISQSVLEYHHHINPGENRLGEILYIFEKAGFGYQLSTWTKPPFFKNKFQDLDVYFYKVR